MALLPMSTSAAKISATWPMALRRVDEASTLSHNRVFDPRRSKLETSRRQDVETTVVGTKAPKCRIPSEFALSNPSKFLPDAVSVGGVCMSASAAFQLLCLTRLLRVVVSPLEGKKSRGIRRNLDGAARQERGTRCRLVILEYESALTPPPCCSI